jgi:hypothetical protein
MCRAQRSEPPQYFGARVIEHLARIRIQLPTSCPEGRCSAPSRSASCRPAREPRGIVPRRAASEGRSTSNALHGEWARAAAMWLQFALDLAGGVTIKPCARDGCPKAVIAGPNTGRRSSSRYCSVTCRYAAHYARRKKKRQAAARRARPAAKGRRRSRSSARARR